MSSACKDVRVHLIHLAQLWKTEGLAETIEPLPFLTIPVGGLPLAHETLEVGILVMDELRKAESLARKASAAYLKEKLKVQMTNEEDEIELLLQSLELG